MEARRSFENSISIYQTTHYRIPEDINLHTHLRENLKSHKDYGSSIIVYSADARL
jgi:hypothetical protein